MNKLPENWGKGKMPEGWAQKDHTLSSIYPKNRNQSKPPEKKAHSNTETTNTVQETPKPDESFSMGNESKATLDSAPSNINKTITQTDDSVTNSVKPTGKKERIQDKAVKDSSKSKFAVSKTHREKKKLEKVLDTESDIQAGKAEKENRTFNKKILIFIIFTVITVAAIGTVIVLLTNGGNNGAKDVLSDEISSVVSQTESSEEPEESSELSSVANSSEAPSEPAVNLNSYIGYWHVDESTEQELTIASADKNTVHFSLWYYRLTSVDNITAELDGNVADFIHSTSDKEDYVKGSLAFLEDSIAVTITESNIPYLPIETMVFNNRHGQSWEKEGYENQTESETPEFSPYTIQITAGYVSIYGGPGYSYDLTGEITEKGIYTIVEEKEIPGEGKWGKLKSGIGWINLQEALTETSSEPYGETPNVYCPNCGYGFFTTGVGISGFECPECHYKFNDPVDSHSQEFFDICGYYEAYEMLVNGEHVDTVDYDGQLTLSSDGTAFLSASGTNVYFNWDVGEMWHPSTPSEKIRFEGNGEYLTLYVPDNISWVFKKIY